MTRKILLLAVSCSCLFIITVLCVTGCRQAIDTTGTAVETTRNVIAVQLKELEDYFKTIGGLPKAKAKLAQGEDIQRTLADDATKCRVEVRVREMQIARLGEERRKSEKAFVNLQDAAIQAGLPKFVDATENDKQKQISVSGKTLSGNDVYQALKKFKKEIEDIDKKITDANTERLEWSNQAEEVNQQSQVIARNCEVLRNQIREYERLQERLNHLKKINDLQLASQSLMNTEGINKEMQEAIDRGAAILDEMKRKGFTAGVNVEELKGILTEPPKLSITENDLI